MSREEDIQRLGDLVKSWDELRKTTSDSDMSEDTIRVWLNELLNIFGWDVRDTSQVLLGKKISGYEIERVQAINSQHSIPDYIFVKGKSKITFLDAKNISITLETNLDAAFQIRSYGWSVSAPVAFLSNFEEFCIHDTTFMPEKDQPADWGRILLHYSEYIEQYDLLNKYLNKENILRNKLRPLLEDASSIEAVMKSPDEVFAETLLEFRRELANIIVSHNDNFTEPTSLLNFLVQTIINRIIFIRVCEARLIETPNRLLEFSKRGFWDAFLQTSYGEFFEHYDGPLFERIRELKNISIPDETFDKFLQVLYYPSPYKFDVIPPKLLSDLYELFLARRLVQDETGNIIDEYKHEFEKTKGAVSTPTPIIKKILSETIDLSAVTSLEELENIKILDMAAGSGAFLVEAFDLIEEKAISLFSDLKNSDFETYFTELEDEQYVMSVMGRRRIISRCLHGVDIDPEAVEVAKMSLCLKVVEYQGTEEYYLSLGITGEKILCGVGENILCGNSLVNNDILEKYPDILDQTEELEKVNPFDWFNDSSFKEVSERGGFHYIVGNPPYVEVKHYKNHSPFMHTYIKEQYETAKNGKVDLSVPFLEKAIGLTNSSGKVGFIIQKRLFKTDYGKRIREKLTSENELDKIIEFNSTKIFKDRITYVAILITSKEEAEVLRYQHYESDPPDLFSEFLDNDTQFIDIPLDTLGGNPWNLDNPEILMLIASLSDNGCLNEYANVKVGIQVLWDNAYHLNNVSVDGDFIIGDTGLEENVRLEREICRPLVENINFYPFRPIEPVSWAIFPYRINNQRAEEISFSVVENEYPLTANYLMRNKDTIIENVETNPEAERWHLYTRAQNHSATYPKVFIPNVALDTFASFNTNSNMYCDNANIYFLEIEDPTRTRLLAISAIINSTIFSLMARTLALPQQNGYYKFNKQFLDPVPFPIEKLNDSNVINHLAELADNLISLGRRYIQSDPSGRNTFQKALEIRWTQLDEFVNDLYELTEEQEDLICTLGRNISRIRSLVLE